MKKSEIITYGILGGLFVALLVLFIVVFNMFPATIEESTTQTLPTPEIEEGEGIYIGSNVLLYPEIKTENVLEIDVTTNEYSYGFHMYDYKDADGKVVKTAMAVKGHEDVAFDMSVYAYLLAYARLPVVPRGNTVYRDQTPEQMKGFGVTPETAQAQVKIKFKDGEEIKEHIIYIGHKVLSYEAIYYATVDDRDSVYVLSANGVEGAILKPLTSYVSPSIYGKYSSAAEAALGVEQFLMAIATRKELQEGVEFIVKNEDGSYSCSDKLIFLLEQQAANTTDTSTRFSITFDKIFPQKVTASTEYITGAFGQLFTAFSGELVVAIGPTDEEYEKYGLGLDDEVYYLYASYKVDEKDKDKENIEKNKFFIISKPIDGYHYVLSTYHSPTTPTIVQVPAEYLSFLGNDEQTLLNWSATNTVHAGFSEHLRPDVENDIPGIKTIRIKLAGYDELFTLHIDPATEHLTVTCQHPEHPVFKHNIYATEAGEYHQFSNLYQLLICYPTPSRFTEQSKADVDKLKADGKLIYELEVEMNSLDGNPAVIHRYTYYQIDASYAVCVSSIGTVLREDFTSEDGTEYKAGDWKWDETICLFDVKMRHILLIEDAFKIIMNGGTFNPRDYIV